MDEKSLKAMYRWLSTLGTVNALQFVKEGLDGLLKQSIPVDDGLSVRKLTAEEVLANFVKYLNSAIKSLDQQIAEYKKTLESGGPK